MDDLDDYDEWSKPQRPPTLVDVLLWLVLLALVIGTVVAVWEAGQ